MANTTQLESQTEVNTSQLSVGQVIFGFTLGLRIRVYCQNEIWVSGDENGEMVVLKIAHKGNEDNVAVARNEAHILRQLSHPNIVRVLEEAEDEKFHVVVLEFFDGENLHSYIMDNDIDVSEERDIFQQITAAVHYMHENNIAHRDLTPRNVLINKENGLRVKIVDFGFGDVNADTTSHECCGTVEFLAPEMRASGMGYCSKAVDMWGLGGIMYFMVYMDNLFGGVYQNLNMYQPDLPFAVDAPRQEIIEGLLEVPDYRMEMTDLMGCEYFTQVRQDPGQDPGLESDASDGDSLCDDHCWDMDEGQPNYFWGIPSADSYDFSDMDPNTVPIGVLEVCSRFTDDPRFSPEEIARIRKAREEQAAAEAAQEMSEDN